MIGLIVFSVFALYCVTCMIHEIHQINPRTPVNKAVVGFVMNQPVIQSKAIYPEVQVSKIVRSND